MSRCTLLAARGASRALLCLLAAAPLAAAAAPSSQDGGRGDAPPAGELPNAEEVLAEVEAAWGPAAQRAARKNVAMHGEVAWLGLEGVGSITEVYAGLGRSRITSSFSAYGTFESGCADGVAWEDNTLGITVRYGWDASQYMRVDGIMQLLGWKELYERAKCTGVEELDGRRCYRLELVPRALAPLDEEARKQLPPPDVWLVDAESYRLRRVEARSVGMFGEPTVMAVELADWRPVDGLHYPFRAEVTISGFTLLMDYESIEHDRELPEGFFEPSEAVRAEIERQRDKSQAARAGEPRIERIEERHIASIRTKCKQSEIQRTLTVLLPEAMGHVIASGATMAGPPLVRYHGWGEELDLEAAIPIAGPIEEKGRVRSNVLPGGEAVVAWHVGPYDRMGDTHVRLNAWIEQHHLKRRGAPWEEYWTDPGMEPDPSKWRTRVVYPIAREEK